MRLLDAIVLTIDGYNVIAPVAAPGRGAPPNWLATERIAMLDRVSRTLDETVRLRTCVGFDAKGRTHDRRIDSRFIPRDRCCVSPSDHPEATICSKKHRRPHHAASPSVVSSTTESERRPKENEAGHVRLRPLVGRLLDGYLDLLCVPQTQTGKGKNAPRSRERTTRLKRPSLQSRSAEHHAEMKSMRQSTTMLSDDDLNDRARRSSLSWNSTTENPNASRFGECVGVSAVLALTTVLA